jgi:cathepsin L
MRYVWCGVVVLLNYQLLAVVGLNDEQFNGLWKDWKIKYSKLYSDDVEDGYRREVFASNVDYITAHNLQADLGQHSFTLGINEYSDLTLEEMRKQLMGTRVPDDIRNNVTDVDPEHFKYDISFLPDSVDWRTKGAVTPVKNQGQCGSCWSFSSTGALEAQNFKKTGQLVSLSEQNLVDCSRSYGNQGCDGGLMNNAFRYVAVNRGIDTESSYPYEAVDNACRFKRANVGGTCTGSRNVVPAGDESALMTAVATIGPIAVAIDASHQSFQNYRSGVYNEPACSSRSLDHGVLVVGYGTYQGIPYWLVKNSWGTSWGISGYVMMSRNKSNQCGIASMASYPTI